MKRRSLFTLLWSICLVLILGALPFLAACAQPAPAPAPAPTPAPAPAPAPTPAPTQAPKAETIILRAVTYDLWSDAENWGLRELITRFNEQAKGEAFIQYLGGEEVVPGDDQPAAVMKGIIDMSNIYAGAYEGYDNTLAIVSLTRLTPMEERESGFFDILDEAFRGLNVFVLGRHEAATRFYMVLNFKPNRYQDLAGHKMNIGYMMKAPYEAWGVVGLDVDEAEVYTAFERGLLEGGADPLGAFHRESLYEVVDYIVDYPFGTTNSVVTINLDAWNKLPLHLQDLMVKIQIELEPEIVAHFSGLDDAFKKTLVEKGMELIYFESEQNGKEFVDSWYDTKWEEIKDDYGPELYQRLREVSGE